MVFSPMEEKMKTIKVIFVLALLHIIVFYITSCNTRADSTVQANKINVQTALVKQKILSLPINTSGKLYTSAESKLSFKIPGIIARIYADEGQMVPKNTLLAELDLIEMKAKVSQARSAESKTQRDLERVKRLYADSVATLEQLQNVTTALDIATSDVKVAEFNLRHAAIYAPERGKILKRLAEEGELLGSGTPVFLYGSYRNGWVIRAGVTDQQIVRLQIGDAATVRFDAYPDKIFTASVSEIEAVANPYTGTFEVELQLEASNVQLYSGFVGKVRIKPANSQMYSMVPVEALIEGVENDGYVYQVIREENRVKKHKIKIDRIYDDFLLVTAGLDSVKEVVTIGAPYLSENSLVNIIE
jgi:RND family efflux transporter MFP subunit